MKSVIPPENIRDGDRERVGGKAFSLAMMARHRMNVPDVFCISTEAHRDYVASTGSRERILLAVNRKNFDEMRWEEMLEGRS